MDFGACSLNDPQQRRDDGITFSKLVMAIACPLVVAAIVWLFSNTLETMGRVDHITWWLRYKGLLP